MLEELKIKYEGCSLCTELKENRTNVVFGVGKPEKAKVVIFIFSLCLCSLSI